jgi:GAF domain-containing protein
VASYGTLPAPEFRSTSLQGPSSRALRNRETVHVHDLLEAAKTEYPESEGARFGVRTILCTPMLREGAPIGVISIRRTEVRPFSQRQIKLLESFGSQAVIAIENVRLFKELGDRNAELREALEHQTATSEVLGIISRSPTDVQPVLAAIVESAVRVCGIDDVVLQLREGNVMAARSHFGPIPIRRSEISIDEPRCRWMREHGALHIPDARAQNDFPEVGSLGGSRTFLLVPLRQQGELIGILGARRVEVRPFNPVQIKLLETFADQAVIALESVRLFNELKESLEQQTATSEILGVIASSPTNIQPVLDAIAQSAARVCGSDDAAIRLREGDEMILAAHFGTIPPSGPERRSLGWRFVSNEALLQRRTIHIPDLEAEAERFPDSVHIGPGIRTFLVTPLLREGTAIGVINIRRTEVKPFTDKQVALLETFASQAVIAIQNVRLFKELQDRNRQLTEALEQQTATSEILSVIASSPTDIQPVLDTVAENAARLCEASDAQILRVEGDILRLAASYGSLPTSQTRPINRQLASGRAVIDRTTIHVHDIALAEDEFPVTTARGIPRGIRTFLVTPLLCKADPIGAVVIRRTEVRPFSEKQIALLKTFADQAVIAIENVRLFKELQERNAELREALEHQTATAEVLGIISRSPTDVQPVLDAIVESAARVCGIDDVLLRLREGNTLVARAHFGPIAVTFVEQSIDRPHFRWMRDHGTLHVPDVRAQTDFPTFGSIAGFCTYLAVPLQHKEEFIGALTARRMEMRAFTTAQIKLLETFADQAVIAIENVRLFKELQERNRDLSEALEQQTATSRILEVIASSPTDLQPVMDAIAESAARLCDGASAFIQRVDGNVMRRVAAYPYPAPLVGEETVIDRGRISGRAITDRQTIHVHDVSIEVQSEFPGGRKIQPVTGTRSALATPLLREGVAIGAIFVRRTEVRPFTEKQVALLKTFADQAVIAIENVRLFKELQERNSELREALEHQTATAEVLGIISRSPTDVQPVLDAIVESAARVCGVDDVVLRLRDGDVTVVRAHFGPIPGHGRGEISLDEPHYG